MQTLVIRRPDDWHVHLREGELLNHTVPGSAAHFHRVLAMPNLSTPLTTLEALLDYRQQVLKAAAAYPQFAPYFNFYLNETVLPETLVAAKKYPFILGGKLYPAGVTTNSEAGAQSIRALYPLFDVMQTNDLVLQIHGEVIAGDIFEREVLFLEAHLKGILKNFPRLRIVLEHISTKEAVQFVKTAPDTLTATITPHHLMYDRNRLLAGGIRPHYYCLPILKHANDRAALQAAAISGNPKFFAGTDSAPHGKAQKECASGCAGIYVAPFALAMYAEVFDSLNALDKLDDFLSRFGAEFYQLPLFSSQTLTLVRKPLAVPLALNFNQTIVVPVQAGGSFAWSIE